LREEARVISMKS